MLNLGKKQLNFEEQELYQRCFTDVLRKISESEKTIRIGKAALEHFTKQKEAIEKGDFHFHLYRCEIVFDDPKLNGNYQDQ